MASGLKPCPFCGGEARIVYMISSRFGRSFSVECPNCNLAVMPNPSNEDAVEAWNRRYVDTDSLLALAAQFECGSGVWLTGREVADRIREAVGE